MTDDFKKGLATGLAIGGVTVIKKIYGGYTGEIVTGATVEKGTLITQPLMASVVDSIVLTGTYIQEGNIQLNNNIEEAVK